MANIKKTTVPKKEPMRSGLYQYPAQYGMPACLKHASFVERISRNGTTVVIVRI